MSLLHKPDWDQTKQHFLAWWAHDAIGRAGISVTAPRDNRPDVPSPKQPTTPLLRWTDLDYISELSEYKNSQTFFGGEAFPDWGYGSPGYKSIHAILGCTITLDFRTGWAEPILDGEDLDVSGLHIDEDEPHWQFMLSWARRGAAEAAGKAIPGVGAFGGSGDTLSCMRGTARLLIDLIERPDQVRQADQYLMDIWCQAYDRLYEITREAAEGSTCWFNLWSPGKFFAAQNDFSFNISPAMFRDIFLPTIERQTKFLDHTVYHVDGVDAFAHVDALCELPQLDALQILPGAGKPSPLHYLDELRKVQAAGKNLHITIRSEEVADALSLLSARGLMIQTSCNSQAEAEQLLKDAEKWSQDRNPAG